MYVISLAYRRQTKAHQGVRSDIMLLHFLAPGFDSSITICFLCSYDSDIHNATNYGHLPTPNCCHISAILPPEIRKKSKPVTVTVLSPGGMPITSFLGVPVIVHRSNTLSPLAMTSS